VKNGLRDDIPLVSLSLGKVTHSLYSTKTSPSSSLRLCLGVWWGGEGKTLWGQKYIENLRNLLHFLKEYFLVSDKLMFMVNIFLIFFKKYF